MLELLLITVYIVFFLALIVRWRFFALPGIGKIPLVAVFILKIAFALFYGVLYQTYYTYGDTFNFYESGLLIYERLFTAPGDFFYMVFGPGSGMPPAHLEELAFEVDYWGNKGSYFMVRLNALLSIFSLGIYNVHAVIAAFLSFVGLTAIYKLLSTRYPQKHLAFAVVIFLVPSILLYGSALHKEAILIFFLGLLIYNFQKLATGAWKVRHLVVVIISTFMIFMVKDFILAALVPCLAAYGWYKLRPQRPFLKFAVVFVIFWIAAFNVDLVFPALDIESKIADRQARFMELNGHSDIQSATLEPSALAWAKHLPNAIVNTTLRPFPGEIQTIYQGMYWLEILMIILLTFFALLFIDRGMLRNSPLVYFAFFFFITLLLIIGLVVNNLGAISRYKTPAILFYLCFLVILTDLPRLSRFAGQAWQKLR